MATSHSEPRTAGHALTDVMFGIEYGSLNERFWSSLNTLLNVVQIVAGFLALAGALKPEEGWGKWAIVGLAVISGLQLTLDPLRRSIAYRDTRMQFHELKKRVAKMDLAAIDGALEDIRKTAPLGNRYLVTPAQNAVLAQLGHGRDRLSFLQWLFEFLS
jgi:hypothetical protein